MRVETRDGSRERAALLGMAVSDAVLGRVAPRWGEGLFASPAANLVGSWCVEYHARHGKAPGRDLESILRAKSAGMDEGLARQAEALVSALGADWERVGDVSNPDHALDQAGEHFAAVRLARLAEEVQGHVRSGRVDIAEALVAGHARVDLGIGAGVDLYVDREAMRSTFTRERREPLVRYDGALGEFWGDQLGRDCFVAIWGVEKGGKCISEDMEIPLADGRVSTIRRIVEQRDSTPALSLDEQTQRFTPVSVSQFWDNGLKECWEVKTKSGRRIVTTGNHRYLTPDGWQPLTNIELGSFIAVAKRLDFFGSVRLPEYEVRFISYMLAEGCCVSTAGRHNNIACDFTNIDPLIRRDFRRCCRKLGFKCRHYRSAIRISGGARHLLRRYGLAGRSARTKTIPDQVFHCPKDQVAMFLRVFFSCDGSIPEGEGGKEEICVSLASRRMVRQIGHLLTRFGIVYKFRYKPSKCNDKEFKAWEISISSREYLNLFLEHINFMSYKETEPLPDLLRRSFLDKFPPQIASRFLAELEAEYSHFPLPQRFGKGKYARAGHAFREAFGKSKIHSIRTQVRKGLPIMRQSFMQADPNSPAVSKYMGSDVLWDEVVSIKSVGIKRTYDLGIETTHNFVANDCVVHNSYALLDIAFTAMCQRRRVAYFQAGDLSEWQVKERLLVRAAGRPSRSTDPRGRWPCVVRVPVEVRPPRAGEHVAEARFEERTFKRPLDKARDWDARIEGRVRGLTRSKRPYLRLSCHATKTLSVANMRAILESWGHGGYVPDVVVVDYADILAPASSKDDRRDQVKGVWEQLRRLSQELHCLVVTGSQVKADAYKKRLMDRSDFSENHLKNAEVTGAVALNTTAEEKEAQLCRLNWIVRREGAYSHRRELYVANCLPLATMFSAAAFQSGRRSVQDREAAAGEG